MKNFNHVSGIAFLTLSFGPCAANAQPAQGTQNMVAVPKPPRVIATGPSKQVTQDLLDFAEILNTSKIYPDGQKWVYGARPGFFGANQWARETDLIKMRPIGISLQIVNLTVDKMEAEAATATVTYSYAVPAGFPNPERDVFTRERVEVLQLKLGAVPGVEAKKWQIVPPDTAPPTGNGTGELENVFARASYVLAQKPGLKVTNEKAKRSMSNLKQLSLGVLQFMQDYDEHYAFAPEYLQEAIFPYVKSKELFLVPNSQEAYSFNANLTNKSIADVKEPSKIVMFYEGGDEKPTFRYDGKAVIGYADGHVRLVTPEEAKDLIWKP